MSFFRFLAFITPACRLACYVYMVVSVFEHEFARATFLYLFANDVGGRSVVTTHPIRVPTILATLDLIDWRIPVVEYLAGKPQGTAFARIAQLMALQRGATIELAAGESIAADKPLRFPVTDDEAIAWGLALAAIHMLPNRERIWI